MDDIINAGLSGIFFSIWPPVAVNVHYFMFHAIDGLGGGAIVETLHCSSWHTEISAVRTEKHTLRS